jgi:hypothetical protein
MLTSIEEEEEEEEELTTGPRRLASLSVSFLFLSWNGHRYELGRGLPSGKRVFPVLGRSLPLSTA